MSLLRMALLLFALSWSTTASAVPDRGMNSSSPKTAADVAEAPPQNPIPAHRLYYSFAVFARINPLGLISSLNLGYRGRLMKSDSILFNDTYGFVGVSARASPAFGRIGGHVEVQPIALFKAWATYEFIGYFGTFDQIIGFDSAADRWSDRTIAALGDAGRAGTMIGTVFTTGATLQAKVGPVAVRNTFQATRFDLALENGAGFFYDQYWDRLAPDGNFMFLNDLDVMGFVSKARVGARWSWSDAIVGDNDTDAGLSHHRFGPLFAWQFHDRGPGARFDKPTLFVLAQWWLRHPYRAGQEQPQGLPLIAVGLSFQGDLFGDKPPGRAGRKGRAN